MAGGSELALREVVTDRAGVILPSLPAAPAAEVAAVDILRCQLSLLGGRDASFLSREEEAFLSDGGGEERGEEGGWEGPDGSFLSMCLSRPLALKTKTRKKLLRGSRVEAYRAQTQR